MTITEVYQKYRINKGLQEHMIRVAAVAKLICDNSQSDLPTQNIVDGCLVHDMGNLIKANMDSFQEFFEPEGVEYWQKVKDEMIVQYGNNVETAARAVIDDMNLADESKKFFHAIGNEPTKRVLDSGELGEKIATYSDMRVGPHGIVLLRERMDDIRARYINRPDSSAFKAKEIAERQSMLEDMERDIFAQCHIAPEGVNDESTVEIQKSLWNWEVSTNI